MTRLFGFLKVALIMALDFFAINSLFNDPIIASIAVVIIGLYVLFGGHLSLLKEGAVSGIFGLIQRGIVLIYRAVLSLISCHAEYRSDGYCCALGYGVQMSHFLSISEPPDQGQLTLTAAMYRSHPPTHKRLAHLEKLLLAHDYADSAGQ